MNDRAELRGGIAFCRHTLVVLALLIVSSHALAATHFIDLRPQNLSSGAFQNGVFKLRKGGSLTLLITDSAAHNCAIFGINTLNPLH
jgi:hypothetical protein